MSSLASACMKSEQASATRTHYGLISAVTAVHPGISPLTLGDGVAITGA